MTVDVDLPVDVMPTSVKEDTQAVAVDDSAEMVAMVVDDLVIEEEEEEDLVVEVEADLVEEVDEVDSEIDQAMVIEQIGQATVIVKHDQALATDLLVLLTVTVRAAVHRMATETANLLTGVEEALASVEVEDEEGQATGRVAVIESLETSKVIDQKVELNLNSPATNFPLLQDYHVLLL